jgi:hypothetical protein
LVKRLRDIPHLLRGIAMANGMHAVAQGDILDV